MGTTAYWSYRYSLFKLSKTSQRRKPTCYFEYQFSLLLRIRVFCRSLKKKHTHILSVRLLSLSKCKNKTGHIMVKEVCRFSPFLFLRQAFPMQPGVALNSLCSPRWPGTGDLLSLASGMLVFKACASKPGRFSLSGFWWTISIMERIHHW